MNKKNIHASCLTLFSLALIAGGLIFFSSCIDPNDNAEINPTLPDNQYSDCLPIGQPCGGKKLCCPTEICKGGVCQSAGTCVGRNGHCSSSGDCCGTLMCSDTVCK